MLDATAALNYLAPVIIAAIQDGHQPPGLTRKQPIFAGLPMDWVQQGALLGFAEQIDPSPRDLHYRERVLLHFCVRKK